MRLLFLLSALISVEVFSSVKIENLKFVKQSQNKGKVIIYLNDNLKSTPELEIKNDIIQVSMSGASVWPKIEKKVDVSGRLDTTLMAYQYNKDVVRFRTVLPYNVSNQSNRISIDLKKNAIELNFPIKKMAPRVSSINKVKVKKETKTLKEKYDESYLAELLKDQEETVPNKFKKDFKQVEKNSFLSEDKVKNQTSGLNKTSPKKDSKFSLSKYIGKFVAFLGLILLVFYAIVKVLKKGIFNKGKLSFLKNSQFVSVINTTYIGPKRSLLLVKVHDQIVLLGNSENGISFLKDVDGMSEILKGSEQQSAGFNFDQKLEEVDNNKQAPKVKLKEDITKSKSKLDNFLNTNGVKEKVKLSEKIKKRAKNLRPMQ